MAGTTVLVLGTCDTKLQELLFLKNQVRQGGVRAILLDVGREDVQHEEIDISQVQLLREHGDGKTTSDLPRGEVVKLMASCAEKAVKSLWEKGEIAGVISAGGSGGTSLAAQVMRNVLPIGFPKVEYRICFPFFWCSGAWWSSLAVKCWSLPTLMNTDWHLEMTSCLLPFVVLDG